MRTRMLFPSCLAAALLAPALVERVPAGAVELNETFERDVRPLLEKYCYDCHANGANEGSRAFDGYPTREALLQDRGLWWAVLKNIRGGVMPPAGENRPTAEERERLFHWIKQEAFGIDPAQPDPGRVTVRRLNRTEYRNTIRDLMGVDYDTEVEFPPDDSGSGFDNIGDALTLSPLLFEKYLLAADAIVDQAVPRVSRVIPEQEFLGESFPAADGKLNGNRLDFYTPAAVSRTFSLEHAGTYHLDVDVKVKGSFDFDPGRCRVSFRVDGDLQWQHEFVWADSKESTYRSTLELPAGEHRLDFELQPLAEADRREGRSRWMLQMVRLQGPLERKFWKNPPRYSRFFPRPDAPTDPAARDEYAAELIRAFATRAFRRPVDDATLARLLGVAKQVFNQPKQTFEQGIAAAMKGVLSSPRFLFRFETAEAPRPGERFPEIDEYSLASRLSYFLWSTMPDEELFALAARGELRKNLDAQLARMLRDPKSQQLIRHFAGQWLQSRDVESVSIEPLSALGLREEYEELREKWFPRGRLSYGFQEGEDPEKTKARERYMKLRELRDLLSPELRTAMRKETELLVEHIFEDDRSLLELIDCNYTFLNERLAKHYGIDGVKGEEMRLVELPEGSPRGGILTQASFLMVTSNPTRTSPVKRGLFILENILGAPAPPPPGAVPELEKSQDEIRDQNPTLREVLERHRSDALCASCHARFDPLGLALENFTALGTWRDEERGRTIDAAGQLITGEQFADVSEMKQALKTGRRDDFYRCVSERLLTYALGRGLEYYDEETLDQIVASLEAGEGRFSRLVSAVAASAPFQRQRSLDETSPRYDLPEGKPHDTP